MTGVGVPVPRKKATIIGALAASGWRIEINRYFQIKNSLLFLMV